jgi:hypothetical protein
MDAGGTTRRFGTATVVAAVAIVFAVAGTATAGSVINGSSIRNRSISGDKLRIATLTGINVRNASLPGTKLRADSVTGAQVNEATLVGVRPGRLVSRKLALGEQATVFTDGAVSLSAKCYSDGVNEHVDVYAVSAVAGAVMKGTDDRTGPPGDTLEPGTLELDRQLLANTAPAGTTNVDNDVDEGWIITPDGRRRVVDGDAAALGLNYLGSKCFVAFSVYTDTIS